MKRLLALSLLFLSTSALAKTRDAYILSVGPGPGVMLLTTGISIEDAVSRRQHYGHDFLWVRRNGHDYLIRDAGFLARADELFAPQRALEPEQQAVAKEERALDHEIDRLEDASDHHDRAVRDRLREYREKIRVVEARERELDDREEALEKVAEDALWRMVDDAIRSGLAKRD